MNDYSETGAVDGMRSPLLSTEYEDRNNADGKGQEHMSYLEEKAGTNESGHAGRIILKVTSPGNPTLQVEVDSCDSVSRLKEMIEAKCSQLPKERQRIIYHGRELPLTKIIGEDPNPLINGATVHLALRPESRLRRLRMNGEPDTPNSADQESEAPEIPIAIELVAQEIMFTQISLNRSSKCTKAVGVSFAALASLFLLRGATAEDWGMISAGILLLCLGLLGIHAGRHESTCIAAMYYYGVWGYMVFLAFSLAVPYVLGTKENGENESTFSIFLTLMVQDPA
uniref:Ubiquitin-like domain-containing protein n=1 Tax=Norrisiella sphaerica TaxID=552664 RepID=A0A7S2VVH2_9EUKA|mmetsp:Transcript_330/g.476  ORF Transcript_330/g.476 Transcript_330/m.476 type:complete len:283 (+) Transcript_330:137-985(+)